jgi:hypothetical protein
MPINAGQVNRNIRRVDTDLITHFQNHSTSAALDDADATKIMAEFHDNVLTVHLPKAPQRNPNRSKQKGDDAEEWWLVRGLRQRTSSSDAGNRCRRR